MKRLFTFALLLLIVGTVSSQNYSVKQSDFNQITISFTSPEFDIQETILPGSQSAGNSGPQFSAFIMNGFSQQSVSGKPALPTMVKTIEIPLGDGLQYEVLSIHCDTLDGASIGISKPILPAQPSRSKSDTNPVTLTMDNATYTTNAFCGEPTIVVEDIGVARDRNLASIAFNPVSWNPVTNQVAVVRYITVAIQQRNADMSATMRMKRLHASHEYGFGIDCINQLGENSKEARSSAPIRYTIVAHSMFRGALDEFVAWKRRKGFLVDIVYTDESNVGSTTTSIRDYLKDLYTNATESEPAPTYVLLVGDVEQIPAFRLYTSNSHYSDLNYACWTDNDNIPDCYIGRFSAQNLEQLAPQISKTLMYEQYTFPNDSYLGNAVLIAGVDGGSSGDFGYTHADPTMDYIYKNYINSDNGFTNITYYKNNVLIHPESVTVTGSSQSNGTASALRTLYNDGCGFVNYSAHGDKTNWSNPTLTVDNVGQMNNQNKPMIAIGNCCLSNSFQISTCLGEAFLRKDNNAGGVGYIGASEVTYWNEDVYWSMGPRTQISATMSLDYNASNNGMYDQLFHTHGESFDKWHITTGAMLFAGNMAVQSSSTNSSMKKYYWEVYHLMGDPSLMPYINGPAQTMSITVPDNFNMGTSTIDIQCPPNTYVALTDEEHNLIAATFSDINGIATLNMSNMDIQPGEYEIAAWAQGYRQHFSTLTVAPTDTYVKATSLTNLNTVKAGQEVAFDLTIENIGILPADSLWIEFRSADDKMLINNTGIITLPSTLNPGSELTINNACTATVWHDVEDNSNASVIVRVGWGNSTNTMTVTRFDFTVAAPKVTTQSYDLTTPTDTSNETILSITSINNGHADIENATAWLLSLDPSIVVENNRGMFSMNSGETYTVNYPITFLDTTPVNRVVPMLYTVSFGELHFTDSLLINFGNNHQFVDFEDNSWGTFDWSFGSNPWEITTTNPYEGNYCARSKTWSQNAGNNKSSEMSLSISTPIDDSISFYYRVSSESNYDLFNFYIDEEKVMEASGEEGWTRAAFFISAGNHQIKFSYEKDIYLAQGEDAAFIDNLKLSDGGGGYIYVNDTACLGSEYTFIDTSYSTTELGVGVHQMSYKNYDIDYFLTLTVMPVPEAAIEGGDVTIMSGETVRLNATGGSRYSWSSGENHPTIDVYPTSTTTYSVTAFNGRCSSEASTTITIDGSIIGIDNPQLTTQGSQILIFPNPAHDNITIEGCNIKEIVITDIMGRIERRLDYSSSHESIMTNSDKLTLDISDLNNGIHMIQIKNNDGISHVTKLFKR